jgi:hypothetical protein
MDNIHSNYRFLNPQPPGLEPSVSITMLLHASFCLQIHSEMDTVSSSNVSSSCYCTTRRYNPEDVIHNTVENSSLGPIEAVQTNGDIDNV